MEKLQKSKLFDYLFLSIVIILYFASVLLWLHLNKNLPHWDMGRHLYNTVVYEQLWQRVPQSFFHLGSVFLNYYYYPPLVHNVGLLFESIFGFTRNSATASNLVWLILLVYSVYFSTKELFNKVAAITAVFIILSCPILIGQFREFQVDLPLTAMFGISFYLLLKSQNFSNKKYSLIFGIFAGLGMMTKWTYAYFILPTGIIFFILGLMDKKNKPIIVLQNTLVAIISALVFCGPWYLHNLDQLKADFLQNGVKQAAIEGDPYGFNKAAFTWYLQRLAINYLYLPLSLIAITGLFISIAKKRWIPIILIIIFYLLISSLPNKDVRYIMPMMVLIAITASSTILLFENKIYQDLFLGLIFVIFIANNAAISFGKYLPLKKSNIVVNNSPYGIVLSQDGGYTSGSPQSEVCPIEQIIDTIPQGKSARLIGESKIDFSDWAVAYYLEKSGRTWAGQTDDLSNSDYLIYRNTDVLNSATTKSPVFQQATIIRSFDCIDESKVDVLKTVK